MLAHAYFSMTGSAQLLYLHRAGKESVPYGTATDGARPPVQWASLLPAVLPCCTCKHLLLSGLESVVPAKSVLQHRDEMFNDCACSTRGSGGCASKLKFLVLPAPPKP